MCCRALVPVSGWGCMLVGPGMCTWLSGGSVLVPSNHQLTCVLHSSSEANNPCVFGCGSGQCGSVCCIVINTARVYSPRYHASHFVLPLRCYSLSLCGTLPQARALVHYLDGISRRVSVHPVEMEPWDVYITEGALVDPKLHPLEGVVACGV